MITCYYDFSKNVLQNSWWKRTQICLYLESFECYTTSDWLNHDYEVVLLSGLKNLGEKDKECQFLKIVGEYRPKVL